MLQKHDEPLLLSLSFSICSLLLCLQAGFSVHSACVAAHGPTPGLSLSPNLPGEEEGLIGQFQSSVDPIFSQLWVRRARPCSMNEAILREE